MKTIQEIDEKLKKISEEYSKLFDQEKKLSEEKKKLLIKEILDSKSFNRYKWVVKKKDDSGFILKPMFNNDLRFDDIQEKLDIYPHGWFQLNDKIDVYGDDGDLYIDVSDIKSGIEFIKSQDIEIIISKGIIDNIASMEKQLTGLREFVNQFQNVTRKIDGV